jgi:hypothetical protein
MELKSHDIKSGRMAFTYGAASFSVVTHYILKSGRSPQGLHAGMAVAPQAMLPLGHYLGGDIDALQPLACAPGAGRYGALLRR